MSVGSWARSTVRKLVDNTSESSLATGFRKRRFRLVRELISQFDMPIRILDVGGTQRYWETVDMLPHEGMTITLLNLHRESVTRPHFVSLIGDASEVLDFADASFDLVFSNSVIEHVGDRAAQGRFAREVRRVGRYYYVQTPNRYFPIEPHFLFPFFQFLPLTWRAAMHRRLNLGWMPKTPDLEAATRSVASIQLLARDDLATLFPDATVVPERWLGLTKSLAAYTSPRPILDARD